MKSNVMVIALALACFGLPARDAVAAPRERGAAAAPRAEAKSKIASIFRGAPGPAELKAHYADADAIVLFDSLVIARDAENRVSKRRHRAVMLLTDNGINRYGDPRILFNTAKQELAVMTARVYMRDGTTADTRKNGINQTTPFAFQAAPDYTDWQETVVTHVGIEKGCVAELQYVIADKDASPWLSGVEIFGAEDPTIERTIEVVLPAAGTLKHASMNGAPEPATPSAGTCVWTVTNIPGRTPYDGGVWEGDYLPTIVYSTAGGWDEVRAALIHGAEDASIKDHGLKAVVDDATKGMRSPEDMILGIHRVAMESVASINPPYALFASGPRTAERIYASAYATPLDRAVVLMGLLKAAGFDPVPVLVTSGNAWPAEVAAPEIFGKVDVAVPTGTGAELLLDPGMPYERDLAFTLAGRMLVRPDKQSVTTVPAREPGESMTSFDVVLKPGDKGALDGEGNAVMTGLFSPYYLVRGEGTETEDFIKARVKALFGGAELSTWNVRNMSPDRVEIAFHFTVKLPDKKSGERVYLSVPKPFESSLSGIDRVHLERSYCDDAIGVRSCVMEVSCALEAPADWWIVASPEPGATENQIGSARIEAESQSGGAPVVHKTLTLARTLVLPKEYGELRSLLLMLSDDRLVLERK